MARLAIALLALALCSVQGEFHFVTSHVVYILLLIAKFSLKVPLDGKNTTSQLN